MLGDETPSNTCAVNNIWCGGIDDDDGVTGRWLAVIII